MDAFVFDELDTTRKIYDFMKNNLVCNGEIVM
jgi:hypothetical protein